MQDNPEEGELDPAEGVSRRCKKNSSVLSCIGKRTKEGCDRGSEGETVHSGLSKSRLPSMNSCFCNTLIILVRINVYKINLQHKGLVGVSRNINPTAEIWINKIKK